jgi:hypothetical protein
MREFFRRRRKVCFNVFEHAHTIQDACPNATVLLIGARSSGMRDIPRTDSSQLRIMESGERQPATGTIHGLAIDSGVASTALQLAGESHAEDEAGQPDKKVYRESV